MCKERGPCGVTQSVGGGGGGRRNGKGLGKEERLENDRGEDKAREDSKGEEHGPVQVGLCTFPGGPTHLPAGSQVPGPPADSLSTVY